MDSSLFFDYYCSNAKLNCILIMDCDGLLIRVNQAFTDNFDYSTEDLKGRNFSTLFNMTDRALDKPQREIDMVLLSGNAIDENYIVDKGGHEIWVTGEAMLVMDNEGKKFIVKDVVNMQSKKQLHILLSERDQLLDKIFKFSKEICILVLDTTMKIINMNDNFLNLFEVTNRPQPGSPLSSLKHYFWDKEEIKEELRNIIVRGIQAKTREFLLTSKSGKKKLLKLDSRITSSDDGFDKKIYLLFEDISLQ